MTENELTCSNDAYMVENVVKRQTYHKKVWYFIKWKGFSKQHNTWEPSENVEHLDLIKFYEEERKKSPTQRNANRKSTYFNAVGKIWEIERVVDKRTTDGEIEYLLKWKNIADDGNTWEPRKMIKGLKAVRQFELAERHKDKIEETKSYGLKSQKIDTVHQRNAIIESRDKRVRKRPIKVKIVNRRKDYSNKVRELCSKIEYLERKNDTMLKQSKHFQHQNEEAKMTIISLNEKINALEKERNYLQTKNDDMMERSNIIEKDFISLKKLFNSQSNLPNVKDKKRVSTRTYEKAEKITENLLEKIKSLENENLVSNEEKNAMEKNVDDLKRMYRTKTIESSMNRIIVRALRPRRSTNEIQ